jgi:hypothetical protein
MSAYKGIEISKARKPRFESTGKLSVQIETGEFYCRVPNALADQPNETPEVIFHTDSLELLKVNIDSQLELNAKNDNPIL